MSEVAEQTEWQWTTKKSYNFISHLTFIVDKNCMYIYIHICVYVFECLYKWNGWLQFSNWIEILAFKYSIYWNDIRVWRLISKNFVFLYTFIIIYPPSIQWYVSLPGKRINKFWNSQSTTDPEKGKTLQSEMLPLHPSAISYLDRRHRSTFLFN